MTFEQFIINERKETAQEIFDAFHTIIYELKPANIDIDIDFFNESDKLEDWLIQLTFINESNETFTQLKFGVVNDICFVKSKTKDGLFDVGLTINPLCLGFIYDESYAHELNDFIKRVVEDL